MKNEVLIDRELLEKFIAEAENSNAMVHGEYDTGPGEVYDMDIALVAIKEAIEQAPKSVAYLDKDGTMTVITK